MGRPGGVGPPSINLGPPNISENTRDRKLKLKTPLDIVKYSPRVQKKSAMGRTEVLQRYKSITASGVQGAQAP